MSETTRKNQEREEHQKKAHARRAMDIRKAIAGGAVAAVLTIIAKISIGTLGQVEAQRVLEETMPTARFLCSATMTSSATVLALLLTVLGVSRNSDNELRSWHYRRLQWLARLVTIAFIVSAIFLLLIVTPIDHTQQIPPTWYRAIYYAFIATASALGGMMITIVLMLYSTIADVIQAVGIGEKEHPLVRTDGEEDAAQS